MLHKYTQKFAHFVKIDKQYCALSFFIARTRLTQLLIMFKVSGCY